MWWVMIFMSFKTAHCTEKDFYPDFFLMNGCFSIGIYVMVYMMHGREYYIEWTEGEKKVKDLFTKQSERFLGFYTFLVEWHIAELVLAKGMDTFSEKVMCVEESQTWIYADKMGSLFMMMHIIGTMMGTGMARAVFIKSVKDEGILGGVEDVESSDDEDEKSNSKVKEEAKKTK